MEKKVYRDRAAQLMEEKSLKSNDADDVEEKETDDAEENEVETKKMHQMVVKTVEEEEEEYFVGEVRLAKHTLSISSYQILLHPLSIAFNSGSYSAFNPADSISCH
ncbi:hypothetical protein Bca4012_014689 [Brassica carinata]